MCWIVGSPQDPTPQTTCRMCKLANIRDQCPHDTQICTQRKMHPDFDVRYYTNAEVRWTNACGYCKWAKANGAADPKQNRGWPGCCRPPTAKEWVMVKDPGVASVIARLHEVSIPENARILLHQPTHDVLALGGPRPPPPSAPVPIPQPNRSPTIPTMPAVSASAASIPLVPQGTRPRLADEQAISAAYSPPAEERKPMARRLSIGASASLASAVVTRDAVHARPPVSQAPAPPRGLTHKKSGSLQQLTAALSLNSSTQARPSAQVFSDSDSSSTVRSEFTDYLSDESEAELQRQAVERAQLKREEDEFKAARARLANVDTNPPLEWSANANAPRPRHGSGSAASGTVITTKSKPVIGRTRSENGVAVVAGGGVGKKHRVTPPRELGHLPLNLNASSESGRTPSLMAGLLDHTPMSTSETSRARMPIRGD